MSKTVSNSNARLMKADIYGLTKEEKLIEYYRNNPVEAARDILNIELLWYQRIQLRELWSKPYILMSWGRGSAKTFLLAVYATLKAILYGNTPIGVIAPSFRQTSYVFDEINALYRGSSFFRAACTVPTASNKSYEVKFFNGSMIEGLPIGNDGAKIRGRRYLIAILDEFNFHDEDTINLVVKPFLIVKKGNKVNQLIMASSPGYRSEHFYQQYLRFKKMIQVKPEMYSVTERNFLDMLIAKSDIVDAEMNIINDAFESMPLDQFLKEYGGFFPSDASAFFSSSLISKVQPRIHPVNIELKGDGISEYVMAVDPARSDSGDRFAYVILKILPDNAKQAVKVFADKGVNYVMQADIIRREIHLNNFNISKLVIDYGGGGQGIADILMQPWIHGEKVYPSIVQEKNVLDMANYNAQEVMPILEIYNFNIPLIDEMYTNLKADMEHGKIKFPMPVIRDFDSELEFTGKQFDLLYSEMLHISPKATSQGLKFEAPDKPGKDRLTALVMANHMGNRLYAEKLGLIPTQNFDFPLPSWL